MADSSGFEQNSFGVLNTADGITVKFVLTVIEHAFFAVNYAIQRKVKEVKLYRKNYVSTFFACLLDYLHVIPFLIYKDAFNYGEVSLAWAKFANWIQLQLPIFTYAPFSIAFWVTVVLVAILLALNIYIGVANYTNAPGKQLSTFLATLALTGGYQLFFPAAFYILSLPWFCNYRNQTLFGILDAPAVECFAGSNLIAIIIGSMSAIALIALACLSSLVKASVEPVVNDLSATTGVLFRNQYYLTIVFMTINKFLIAPSIGKSAFGHWWEALFNLVALSGMLFTVIYFLPFQVADSNQARGAVFMSLWWVASISFMSVNIIDNPHEINRQLDYILIAGLLPFAILGEYLVKARYAHMSMFATALIEEVKVAQENKKRAAAKAAELGTSADKKKITGPRPPVKKDVKDAKSKDAKDTKGKKDEKSGARNIAKEEATKALVAQEAAMLALEVKGEDDDKKRNTQLYLPKILQDFNAGITTIDIVGRLLWHYSDDKNSLEAAAALLDSAEKAYPESPYVKVLRVSFYTSQSPDPSVHLPKLETLKNMEPGLLSRYYAYKRAVDIRSRTKVSSSSDGENSLDLIAYIEFQNLFSETKKYNNLAIAAIREFWMLFLQKSITAAAFNRAAKDMDTHSQKAVLVYKTMLLKFPKNPQVLTSYAFFLDLVIRNTDEAQRCIRRADEQKAREAEEARNGNVAGQIDYQAVVAITEDASIDQVNKALLELFGYSRNEVLGRNIKLLVPSPWKERHDGILNRYRVTGIAKVIGKTQVLYGHHKEGYSFPMRLLVQERRKENGERNFIGMIQPTNLENKNGTVIISEMGIIKMVTKATLDLFGGYSAGQLLHKNVIVLMIDSFAAGHDNYLKNYRDTGEAKVIGTAGRNVPAKRKDGSTFPAALTVEEGYADGERFFMATIQDTSNVSGTIFIDGFGTVQNSDAGVTQLLGYTKETLLGKNLKSIMPPPYCDYHDMYLERYRRTKVSNVLRSVEGRILPAVHADGSVVQLRAIIQRADSGDASTGNNSMLFKGIIRRGETTGLGAGSRRGFTKDYEIELNRAGVITKITRQILTMLGHPADRAISDFIGQPIEVLVPILPDRPNQQKSIWFTRALKSPELNFYIIMVNKNFTLFPATYCLEENEEGAIKMRIRDICELDALLNIDEVGNVLSLNDDAFMLLGFDPDEVIGRNIKYIQPPEVAEHHDMYLQRYKDTGVARVVGINRNVDAMHRDGTYFPNEIQVTEQLATDGSKIFIGRLRHTKFADRCDKDLVQRYWVNTKNLAAAMSTMSADGQSAVSMTSDGTRKINFKGKKGSSKGSSKLGGTSHTQGLAFIRDDVEAHSVLSNSLNSNAHSGSRSSATSNTKFLTLLSKLKAIKTSNKGDPSSIKLANVLNVMFVVYNIYFIIGLLVISLQPSAVIPYRLLITLLDTDMVVNEIITSAKVLYVDNNPDMVTSYCAWNPKYVTPIKPLCPWIEAGVAARAGLGEIDSLEDLYKKIPYDENRSQHPVRNMLPIYNTELSSVTTRLKTFYTSIRVPGDIFDQVLNGPFELYQFVNGTRGIPSNASYTTLWNVLATLSTATNILATEKELNEQSWRSWQFIVANRVRLTDIFINLARMIPPAATTAIVNNILFHFGMALVGVILTGLGFYFGIVPYVLEVNADRQKIIRLMVLIPKETIHTLVHEVYNEQDEDEEDNEVPGKGGKKEESDDTDSEEDDELSDYGQSQDIAVMADQGLRIYAYIGLALAVLVLPVVGFAIFRYARSFWCFDMIALLNNLAIMYHDMQTLAWQIFSGAYKCTDPTFCYPTAELGVKRLLYYVDEMEDSYIKAVDGMQGSPATLRVFNSPLCFTSANGLQRCVQKPSPYMPNNFVARTANGYGNLVQNVLRSARRYASDIMNNKNNLTQATASSDDFWFLYEVPLMEGEAGGMMAFVECALSVVARLAENELIANICYGSSLGLTFVVFFFVFGALRRSLLAEAKFARAVLSMVPHDFLRDSKPMTEYIETLAAQLEA